ncbi:hypothetical protein [Rheinheimera fenheensis]|uniref:hypothetical protein n=1 Tax=Rheinheimera fenheensis TaxID=3152295 RepID=UPI003260A5DB
MRFYPLLLLLLTLSACFPDRAVSTNSTIVYQDGPITVQLSPADAPVETPLKLTVVADDISAVSGSITGVSMYMGRIPLRFNKIAEGFAADFLLGACADPKMLWQLEIELLYRDGKKHTVKQQFHSSWR